MKMLSIGQTSALLDINQQTLRRWDINNGKLRSHRSGKIGKRYYNVNDIEDFLSRDFKYLLDIGRRWALVRESFEMLPRLYCPDRSIFKARLSKLEGSLMRKDDLKDKFSLVTSIAGEIGNNSFDHNLGNWPDLPGIFFGYNLNANKVLLADRGQGILKTLGRVRKELKEDTEALYVAFTEIISGRSPESRGNGLKYVRQIIEGDESMQLFFQSGKAVLNLTVHSEQLNINIADSALRGCFALIEY
jgi:DNA-binding transcriptional MerR regulator